MSTPTGAGYGFVGSTFGETDLVSPYLQMYDIPKKEVQAVSPPDSFTATAVSEDWNNLVQASVEDYSNLFQNTDPEAMRLLTSKELDPQQAQVAMQLRQSNAQAQKNIFRLTEIADASNSTFDAYSAKVREDASKYSNHHNRKKLQDYQRFSKMIGILPKATSGFDLTGTNGLRFNVTPQGLLEAARDAGIEDTELQRLVDEGAIVVGDDGTVSVNPTSEAFRLSERDFIQSEDWRTIIDKQVRPTSSVSRGEMTKDGVYYNRSLQKQLIADQYATTLLPHVFSINDLPRIKANSDGTIEINSHEVTLEQPALNFAQGMSNIEIIDGNKVSAEDAKSIFNQMFRYGANKEGFTTHTSSVQKGAAGGVSKDKKNTPVSITRESEDGTSRIPLDIIPAKNVVFFDPNESSYKAVEQVQDLRVEGAISVKSNVDISIPEIRDGKIRLNHFILGDDGNIYVRGNVSTDKTDIFGTENPALHYAKKGILESESRATTQYIKLQGYDMEGVMADIVQQMDISQYYPKLDDPKEILIQYIIDNDKARSRYIFGGSNQGGALSGF